MGSVGAWIVEQSCVFRGAGAVEAGAIRNQVAERDAELCVDPAGTRAMVNDICAKPDSLGIASGSRET